MKKKFIRKIASRRGETLVELLVAILIVAFGCMLIAVLYSASMSINLDAQQKDAEFYDAISQIEQGTGTEKSGTMQWDNETNDVKVYGDNGIYFYRK